jgi:5-methyltetrahydropteroyltriglutamate--homocysteine methyltransferase
LAGARLYPQWASGNDSKGEKGKLVSNRILTTHVGSLPRPLELLQRMQARAAGEEVDERKLGRLLADSVREVVARQVGIGLDLVSDGEFSKPSYATYVSDRLTGFGGSWKGAAAADLKAFPDFARRLIEIGAVVPSAGGRCCIGDVERKGSEAVETDIANLKAAVAESGPVGAFVNAASPGVVVVFQKNQYYPSEDAYLDAVAEALRPEYEAIVAAGFQLQIDSPDLAMSRHLTYADVDDAAFVRIVERNVAVLNHATRNIAPEMMRMHVCWGNYAGPHHQDIDFATIARVVLGARPRMLLIEGANPRHGHDWTVLREVGAPEDKVLVPGVIDSTSNYVEHPGLVAERLLRYADVVGRDRLAAGSDCGFSTFSELPTVWPEIVWLKLQALVEGARRASEQLWPSHALERS